MNDISLGRLALAFLPAVLVIAIMGRWMLPIKGAIVALLRMLVQLLLVGYVLVFLFKAENAYPVLIALSVMVLAASWIALRTAGQANRSSYGRALTAIVVGGGCTLLLMTQGVLQLQPWYDPKLMVTLGGMVFANAMNAVSLVAERFAAEIKAGQLHEQARRTALRAALIPITNSLLAVGLVSIPGFMTGQITSGVSPFIAARYQIMVMCMVFASAGLSASLYLILTPATKPT